ncbi:hypothetical protein DHD32_01905 [Arenibacter sp. TNZ]|jgi:hypothetical protein|uniref:hypothetical protein n=1 Tax=Arenibacter TaxID=178469 RepID=UPI000CD40AEF|nr:MULTISPECIES: hypothetical protein [Arenibacter]MCM4170217.1 hypothetical protein [Arenibacter sp. TNZ]
MEPKHPLNKLSRFTQNLEKLRVNNLLIRNPNKSEPNGVLNLFMGQAYNIIKSKHTFTMFNNMKHTLSSKEIKQGKLDFNRVILNLFCALLFTTQFVSHAQIDPNLLLGLNTATTTEMNAISGSITGSMLYNTTDKKIYFYNGTNWVTPSNDNWLLDGNTAVAGASFLGTKNDVAMDIRTNNTSVLKFGRRQTLGLVQAFPDYTDSNQYLTYVGGGNGVSAIQFQADAASFYKPMFYSNSDGNFRLKGSAAGTDMFEIGSAGTANNGQVEFIIGDDGAEPFIFKRYDYRDNLLKELLRIQGSSDTQNALPRVGINTGSLANSTLQVNGSLSTAITTANGNVTLDESHHTLVINSNISITLPAANGATGRVYVLKNTTSSSRTISNYVNGSGVTSNQISAQSTLWVQSNGSTWNSISASGSSSSSGTVVSTDANNIITTGTDGGAYLKINRGGRWTNTNTSTNLNNDGTSVPIFGNENYKDDGNNLYQVSGNTLRIKEAGRYDIRANLFLWADDDKISLTFRIHINGSAVGAIGATGYFRYKNEFMPTIALNEILQLNANDDVTIIVEREGDSGDVHLSGSGASSFNINKIK